MYPTQDEMVESFLTHYGQTTDAELHAGWYRTSRSFARKLKRQYGGGLGKACGVTAALSPLQSWKSNTTLAVRLYETGEVKTLGNNARAALRIYNGERPLRVLNGPKVRNFYRAMMGDENAVTLDRWMMRAAGWPTDTVQPNRYEYVSDALRTAAAFTPLTPAQFQAAVWVHVRGGAD